MLIEIALMTQLMSHPAKGASISSRSSSSFRSSSPRISSSRPAQTYKSTNRYATGRSRQVGTAPLKSATKPPKDHTFNNRTYHSSDAVYTNNSGMWVYFWAMNNNHLECYDKDHKRVTCNRDSKSYQKDW